VRKAVGIFKALSDDTRLRLIKLLESSGEVCVCDIMEAMSISQTRASRNLNILKQAGLVVDRRDKHWIYYSLNKNTAEECCGDVLKVLVKWLETDEEIGNDRLRLSKITRREQAGRAENGIKRQGKK
jgi:DNA-binding transcriptional ArsR family regulator